MIKCDKCLTLDAGVSVAQCSVFLLEGQWFDLSPAASMSKILNPKLPCVDVCECFTAPVWAEGLYTPPSASSIMSYCGRRRNHSFINKSALFKVLIHDDFISKHFTFRAGQRSNSLLYQQSSTNPSTNLINLEVPYIILCRLQQYKQQLYNLFISII